MTLDEAIKVAEADLAEGGFFGAEHLARVHKDLATLRALRTARDSATYAKTTLEYLRDNPADEDNARIPIRAITELGQALAAIAALYPEEAPDAKS